MTIHEFFYNEDTKRLIIEFSTEKDGDKFYRTLELEYSDVEYYSPEIIHEKDLIEIDEFFVIEIITEYLKENELPDEFVL